jgi:hypothetical protein
LMRIIFLIEIQDLNWMKMTDDIYDQTS